MDIDAMKKNWDALNERLENRETVNNEAIKKLLSQKAIGGYDKIRNKEKGNLYAMILFAIIFPIQYATGAIQHWYSFAVIETLIVGLFFYTLFVLKAFPKSEDYGQGLSVCRKTSHAIRSYTLSMHQSWCL